MAKPTDACAGEPAPAYACAEDASVIGWLTDMGVVAIDENGAWRLTALGAATMARFDSEYQMSAR